VFTAINICFVGFFLLPALPICMTFATEVTYPMQASAAGSSILSFVGAMMLSSDVSQGVSSETIAK
jgi:hypothetical protein